MGEEKKDARGKKRKERRKRNRIENMFPADQQAILCPFFHLEPKLVQICVTCVCLCIVCRMQSSLVYSPAAEGLVRQLVKMKSLQHARVHCSAHYVL